MMYIVVFRSDKINGTCYSYVFDYGDTISTKVGLRMLGFTKRGPNSELPRFFAASTDRCEER